jgi:hypothetical protein
MLFNPQIKKQNIHIDETKKKRKEKAGKKERRKEKRNRKAIIAL